MKLYFRIMINTDKFKLTIIYHCHHMACSKYFQNWLISQLLGQRDDSVGMGNDLSSISRTHMVEKYTQSK